MEETQVLSKKIRLHYNECFNYHEKLNQVHVSNVEHNILFQTTQEN